MASYRIIFACLLAGLFLFSTNSFGSLDLDAAPWRGQDGTTYAAWEFSDDNLTPLADVENNPYGGSAMVVTPAPGHSWEAQYQGRTGLWPLSGKFEVGIDNRREANPWKEIWLQLVWATKGGEPIVSELEWGATAELINDIVIDPANGWHHSTYQMFIYPNPSHETIRVAGEIRVDDVIIETICIPEPISLLLLGVGGLWTLRRRRA